MNSEENIHLLKSDPMKFTYAEVEQMMTEEMAKDPAEMDTDFIDLCAAVLCKALDEYEEKKAMRNSENKKRIKFIKLIKIAAVVALFTAILCVATTVSAKYVYNDTSDKIVQFYEDHFSINLRNNNTDETKNSSNSIDLVTKLKESGFDNVILPSVLLTDEYTYDVNITEDEEFLTAFVNYKNQQNSLTINIMITKHKNNINYVFDNDTQITTDYDSAKQLSLNGIDILVFGNKDDSIITYIDSNTEYNISLVNCKFDTAVKTAESIK